MNHLACEKVSLVTIAIPTRNRQEYAAILVHAALEILPDCQVVVNDNSDNDSLRRLLQDRLSDSRLSYRYQPGLLSVIDNFNATLSRSTGEYITMLGDDDIIGPHFHEILLKAKAEGVDALCYRSARRVIHYFWPGVCSPRWGEMGGRLYFSRFRGTVCPLDARKAIRDAIRHLSEGPRKMPRIYLGVVARTLIERVQAKYGPLFGGFSPDVYSSHLLAAECTKPVVVDYPFILPGAGPKSTSAAHAQRSDRGSGETADNHIGRFTNTKWDPRIPNYYSGYTVWSQSLLQAHARTGLPVPLRAFGYCYATCLFFTFNLACRHLGAAIRAHETRGRRLTVLFLTVLALPRVAANYVIRRIPAGIRRRPGGAHFVLTGLANTRAALDRLEEVLGTGTPYYRKAL